MTNQCSQLPNLYSRNSEELLFFAFNNGKIRVTETDVDQSDFSKFWELSMHDNFNGLIPKLCLSHDQRFLFSCGSDGNIFAYTLNCCSEYFTEYKPLPSTYIEVGVSFVEYFKYTNDIICLSNAEQVSVWILNLYFAHGFRETILLFSTESLNLNCEKTLILQTFHYMDQFFQVFSEEHSASSHKFC